MPRYHIKGETIVQWEVEVEAEDEVVARFDTLQKIENGPGIQLQLPQVSEKAVEYVGEQSRIFRVREVQ